MSTLSTRSTLSPMLKNFNYLSSTFIKFVTVLSLTQLVACGGNSSEDITPPVITLLGDNPMSLTLGESFIEPGATATDNVDGEINVVIEGSVNWIEVGTYTKTYRASDNAGNESIETRIINVLNTDEEVCETPTISPLPSTPPLIDSPFEIIIAEDEVSTGQPVNFSITAQNDIDLSDFEVSWFVDDPEDNQPDITGIAESFTYHYPGRFRIVATIAHKSNSADVTKLIDYVNVYRPFDQTIYATGSFTPQGTASIGVPESGQWCNFDYDVYYGKYYEIWVQKNHTNRPSKEILLEALTQGDHIHEKFTEMFGWDLRTKNEAQKIVFCTDVEGPSGGSGGMFINNVGLNPDTGTAGAELWITIIHEFMHQWDFRGDIHLSGPEAAHALTSSQEYLAYTLTDTARLTQYERFVQVNPKYNNAHVERVMYHRYLNDEAFNWESLYNDEIMAMEYGTHPLPENKEHMQIMGGVLMAFYRLHGKEGLRAYYQQIDVLLLEHPEWSYDIGTVALTNEQRTENMLLAMSRAVRFDVSDYFDFWKFPVSDKMRNRLAEYPKSPMILDNDKDGFSPLEGDVNDYDSKIYPESLEPIDGKDNNANGLVDETIIDESRQGDITEVSSQLPLFIKGNISDLADVDIYRFTVPEGKRAVVTTFTKGAHSRIPLADTGRNAGRPNKLFSGSYTIDGHGTLGTIYDWSHLPTMTFFIDGDGSEKSIRVDGNSVDGMNPNPGHYELVVHISDAVNRDMRPEALVNDLYDNNPCKSETKVFLLAGQSNMEGNIDQVLYNDLISEVSNTNNEREAQLIETLHQWYLDNDASDAYSDKVATFEATEMIRLYDQGRIGTQLQSPLNNVYCTFNTLTPMTLEFGCGFPFGPELLLGHEASKVTDKPISLIKVAYGGTTLSEDWRSTSAVEANGGVQGPLFNELMTRIDSISNEPETVINECVTQHCEWNAFIWFQGENDTFIDEGADYEQNLRHFLNDVRAQASPDLPIVIIQVGEWARTAGDHGQSVFDAQAAVANALPNAVLVTTNDLSAYYHYDPAAQLIIGYRVAEALQRLGVL